MKHLSPKQKASIALAALRGDKISKLSSDYQINPNLIWKWKKLAEDELEILFADKRKKENHSQERIIDELYQTIGRREVEISWLKKNSSLSYPERLTLANKEHPDISTLRQAELLDISRSSIYYQPTVNPEDIQIMNAIDEIFTKCPFYGHRRIKPELAEEYGVNIGKKRIISLMKGLSPNAYSA